MQPLAIRHVSVWLDELAPGQGAFAHALEWAWHLRLPLQPVIMPSRTRSQPFLRGLFHRETSLEHSGIATAAERISACAAACNQRGVSWHASPPRAALPSFGQPDREAGLVEICVFGDVVPPPWREELLRRLLQNPGTSVLVCPQVWTPLSRVLILNSLPLPDERFITDAMEICRALNTMPVVLTLARSEDQARNRQQLVERRFAEAGLPADFDFLVGCDVPTAVERVTRWRRCSHVFVQTPNARRWWRCWPDDTMERLLEASETLTFLALPGTPYATAFPQEPRRLPAAVSGMSAS